MSDNKRNIYVVLSQTGTILAKTIHFFTRAPYCHASISFDEDLDTMYSFGRINPYNPFYGGFVRESLQYGTFKRFNRSKAAVIRFSVDEDVYFSIKAHLEDMYERKDEFGYNYKGLYGAVFKKKYSSENRFYCSEFVDYMCTKFGLYPAGTLPPTVRPIYFFKAFEDKVIYQGLLADFCKAEI